ncbi:MAG: hypothetical protein HS104_18975 [Polyangiaceae bacterium]|nr:hypothetical protein [Polyangiaceae bacterium]MCL4752877.1 hypothetical protein [Myxococcales bacterium]
MRTWLCAGLMGLQIACGREQVAPVEPATPPATPAPEPTPVPTVAATVPSAAPADPCQEIRDRFNAELAKRTDQCKTASDCACHGAEGGGCGGVTDSATAKRLAPISKEFHDSKCRYTVQCAAWACEPKCQNGRCTR